MNIAPERWAVVANVVSDRQLRTGAKVWISRMGGMLTCSRVVGLSKGGHRIEKYTHNKRLANFRPGWVPDHLPEKIDWRYENKAAAAKQADFMRELFMGIRQFSRNGETLLRDGATGGAVWIRARSIWANKP